MTTNPFIQTIEILRQTGWTQNPRGTDKKLCIGLALDRAIFGKWNDLDYIAVWQWVNSRLREKYNTSSTVYVYNTSSTVYVNDHILQSQEEAEDLLKKLAAEWEEAHG